MTKAIKELLPTILAQENNWKISLLNNWPSIVGELSSKVRIERIYEDTLILGVQDSCWLQELYLLTPILLRSINKTLDAPHIKSLRFKTIGEKKATLNNKTRPKEMKHCEKILSPQEHQALAYIKDPQLAQALKKFLIRCFQENV